jgi:hypothetical protein
MKTFGFALFSLLSLAAAPAFAGSATPADRSADKGVQLALDVRIGEGGVRIDDERDRYRDRDRRRYRAEREGYRVERGECRTVITREYRHGEQITRKTRRCD